MKERERNGRRGKVWCDAEGLNCSTEAKTICVFKSPGMERERGGLVYEDDDKGSQEIEIEIEIVFSSSLY